MSETFLIADTHFGHMHQEVLDDSRYISVSCEQINLTPIPWDEICNIWAERQK